MYFSITVPGHAGRHTVDRGNQKWIASTARSRRCAQLKQNIETITCIVCTCCPARETTLTELTTDRQIIGDFFRLQRLIPGFPEFMSFTGTDPGGWGIMFRYSYRTGFVCALPEPSLSRRSKENMDKKRKR